MTLRAPALGNFSLKQIVFERHPTAPLWIDNSTWEERPIGSTLAPGEELMGDGPDCILVIVPQPGRYFNPAVYYHHQLIYQGNGSDQALKAVTDFLNASWLQSNDDTRFLEALLTDESVNIRDEGHAVRQGDFVYIWPGESYFNHGPAAKLLFDELSIAININLQFLQYKQLFLERLKLTDIETADDLPKPDSLPAYSLERGLTYRPDSDAH
jgi:hypothetical protein